jgi:uncharacterized membrane protein
MGSSALSFRVMGMMTVVLATAAGYSAVPALWIIGWWFLDAERRLGVFVRSSRAALANARGGLC